MFDNQFRIIYTYSHVGIHEYMNSYKHLQSCFTRTQFLLWCSGARSVCGVKCTCSTFRSMDVTWSWAMSRCAIACAWHVSCSSVGQDCSRKNHCQKPKRSQQQVLFWYICITFLCLSISKEMWCKYGLSIPKKCGKEMWCKSLPLYTKEMWERNVMQMWCKYGLSIPKKCGKEMRYKYASLHQRNVQIYDFPSCASVDQSTACRFYALNRVKQTCIRVRTNHSARLPLQFS